MRGIARTGRAILECVALVGLGIVPTKPPSLKDRMQGIDANQAAREIEPLGAATFAEAPDQIVFRQTGKALADQPVHQAKARREFHTLHYAPQQ